MIIEMEPKHVKQVAALHCQALPGDFLPTLGIGFLEKVLYKSSLHSKYGKTFVFVEGETVGGFITIALDNKRFLKGILRANIHWVAWCSLIKALRNPSRLKEAWDALLNSMVSPEDTALSEIVVIAVAEEFRQKSIAVKLIDMATEYLFRKGMKKCRTKTLSQNLPALSMYKKAGFLPVHVELRGSKEYVVLERELS